MSHSRTPLRQARAMSLETFTNTNARRVDHEVSALDNLLEVSIIVIEQALTLLNETVTTDAQLSFPSHSIPGSTIGKHIRHAHAHFLLLLECIEGGQPYILNYDARKRQTPMEAQVQSAKEELKNLVERFERLRGSTRISLDDPLTLNAVTPDRQVLQSSLGRELWFVALHAVHHWSMVRVVAVEQSLQVEDSLGVAPATLVFRGSEATLGKAKI